MARKPVRCSGRIDGTWQSLTHCLNTADHNAHDIDVTAPDAPDLYRVTYVRTGEPRHTRTMGIDELRWYQAAWYVGIRVTSYRRFVPTRKES